MNEIKAIGNRPLETMREANPVCMRLCTVEAADATFTAFHVNSSKV